MFYPPERIKQIRKTLKLTQQEFGERIGRDRRTVIRWEQSGVNVNTGVYSYRNRDYVCLAELARECDISIADTVTATAIKKSDN